MFWLITGVMLATAVLIVAVPLYRAEKRLSVTSIAAIVLVTSVAGIVYSQIGTPGAQSVQAEAQHMASLEDVTAALAARLENNPDDLEGWKMLGRSYLQLGNFPQAIAALQKAVDMESAQDGQTLVDLGEATLMNDDTTLDGRAGQLFENAVALAPDNPKALFYAGLAAVERGDNALGAKRWEALLATSPPENVRQILQQRIAELRGEVPAAQQPVMAAAPPAAVEPEEASTSSAPADGVVNLAISLGESASAAGLPDATVFVIVRVPDQPGPPVAAIRRRVSELPATVAIFDTDAMIAGRPPSAFESVEVVARVSLTGQPGEQPGDWYGRRIIDTGSGEIVPIVIDEQVP